MKKWSNNVTFSAINTNIRFKVFSRFLLKANKFHLVKWRIWLYICGDWKIMPFCKQTRSQTLFAKIINPLTFNQCVVPKGLSNSRVLWLGTEMISDSPESHGKILVLKFLFYFPPFFQQLLSGDREIDKQAQYIYVYNNYLLQGNAGKFQKEGKTTLFYRKRIRAKRGWVWG